MACIVAPMERQRIEAVPFDLDLELAAVDEEPHSLVFPCRRALTGWLKCGTDKPVNVHPTHWRDWKN